MLFATQNPYLRRQTHREEVRDLTWTALLLLALILSPIVVAVGAAVQIHFAGPSHTTDSAPSKKSPIILDPIDSDGPGALRTGPR